MSASNLINNIFSLSLGVLFSFTNTIDHLPQKLGITHSTPTPTITQVLGTQTTATSATSPSTISFNLPANFNDDANFKKGLKIDGQSITDLISATQGIESIKAGSGINVSSDKNPTITNSGVLSVNNKSGALTLEAGDGVTIDGLKISATSTSPTLTAGSGISVNGLEIVNADPGSAQKIFSTINGLTASSNTDSLTIVAGEGIKLSTDSTSKTITVGIGDSINANTLNGKNEGDFITDITTTNGLTTTSDGSNRTISLDSTASVTFNNITSINNLNVGGTTILNGGLSVTGNSNLNGDLNLTGGLTVGGSKLTNTGLLESSGAINLTNLDNALVGTAIKGGWILNGNTFTYRRQITINNADDSLTLPVNYEITIPLSANDAAQIYNNTRTDHADFRLAFGSVEIPLNLSSFTSNNITFSFQNQSAIAPLSNSRDYFLYYSNTNLATASSTYTSIPDLQLDNGDSINQWSSSDNSGFPLNQENSLKTEGTGSVKLSIATTVPNTFGNIGVWTTESQGQLPVGLMDDASVIVNINGTYYAYVVEGSGTSGVYRSPVDQNGNIGTWSSVNQSQLPYPMNGNANLVSATINGQSYLYVLGYGWNDENFKAPIDSQGNVGSWTAQANLASTYIPYNSPIHATVGTVNGQSNIYIVSDKVVKGTLATNGDISAWTIQTALPYTPCNPPGIFFNTALNSTNYLYILGGDQNDGTGCYGNAVLPTTIYKGTLDSSGNVSTWTSSNQGSLLESNYEPMGGILTIAGSQFFYIVNGRLSYNYSPTTTISRATISTNGDIGNFSTANQNQAPLYTEQGANLVAQIGQNFYAYIISGGPSPGQNFVYKASISSPTNPYTATKIINSVNLSNREGLNFKIRSSISGSPLVFEFSNDNGTTWQTNNFSIKQANIWETKSLDISEISNTNKNNVTHIRFRVLDNTRPLIVYIDDIRASTYSYASSQLDLSSSSATLGAADLTLNAQGSGALKVNYDPTNFMAGYGGLQVYNGGTSQVFAIDGSGNMTLAGNILSVGSTSQVTNLNAQYLNGHSSSEFVTNLVGTSGISITGTGSNRTITLDSNASAQLGSLGLGSTGIGLSTVGSIAVGGSASINSTLSVGGSTILNGGLVVTGNSNLNGDLNLTGGLTVGGSKLTNTGLLESSGAINLTNLDNALVGTAIKGGWILNSLKYDYRRVVTITNTDIAQTIPVNYEINITLTDTDAAQIYNHVRTDHADFHLAYNDTLIPLNISSFTASSIIFSFQIQAPIAPSTSTTSYKLFYSNATDSSGSTTYTSNPDIQLDNANDVSQWTSGNTNGYPLSQETTIKTEGSGSVKQGPSASYTGSPGDAQNFDSVLPQALYSHATTTATINNITYLYVLGGYNGGYKSTVYRAVINSNGNVGTFSLTNGQLPQTLDNHSAFTATIGGINYIYVLGGFNNGTVQSTVYRATIDSNGDIGTFSTTNQGQLPHGIQNHTTTTVVIDGTTYIYIIGGVSSGTYQSAVYRAALDASGNVGAFSTTNQGQLPQALANQTTITATINGIPYLYVLGGRSSSSSYQSTVYRAALDASGNVGTFSTTGQGQLPLALHTHTTTIAAIGETTYVYTFGGISTGSAYQSTVYRASIDSSGNIGSFSTTNQSQLSQTVYAHTTVTATIGGTTHFYILGGYNGAALNTVSKVTMDYMGNINSINFNVLPQSLAFHTTTTATVNGTSYIYIIGGFNGTYQSTVYRAAVDNNGNPGVFSTTNQGQLPQTLANHTTVTATIGDTTYIYVIGGGTTVYRAPLDASGNVGTFSTTGQGQLPQSLRYHTTVTATIGDTTYIYVLGGTTSSTQSTVYRAPLDASGNVGTFSTTGQGQLPQALSFHSTTAATIGSTTFLYVLGGSNTTTQSTVYRAPLDTSGNVGMFSTVGQTQLPQSLRYHTTVTATIGDTSYLYTFGGINSNNSYQSTVYRSVLDASGNVGTFSTTGQGQLPQAVYGHATTVITFGGTTYIHIVGGQTGSSVYSRNINTFILTGSPDPYTATKTITSTDLSTKNGISFRFNSSKTGSFMTFEFSNDGGTTWQTSNFTVNQANVWEGKSFDISAIATENKNNVTQIRFRTTDRTQAFTAYFDDIRATATAYGGITSTINSPATLGAADLTLNAQGSGGLAFNYDPTNSMAGTGGIKVYNGGTTVLFSVDGSGNVAITGTLNVSTGSTLAALSTSSLIVSGSTTLNSLTLGNIISTGALTITGNNNSYIMAKLGLGTSSPNFKLDVQDSQTSGPVTQIINTNTGSSSSTLSLKIGNTNTSTTNNYVAFVDGNNSIIGKVSGNGSSGVTYSTTGSDFAEFYKKVDPAESFETGDLVCQSQTGVTKCGLTSHRLVGVVSTSAGFIGGDNHFDDTNYVLVGLLGQLPVKVTSDSSIVAGDPLTFSSLSGYATKAVANGLIVGYALTDYTPGSPLVRTSINITYYDVNY